jgi:formylglycine-generating enzyme required for sulfatase activity
MMTFSYMVQPYSRGTFILLVTSAVVRWPADIAKEQALQRSRAATLATVTLAATAPATEDEMPLVPAGPFTMGSSDEGEQDERPAHTVTVAAFCMDRTEVTNEAYAECVSAKRCRPWDDKIATRNHAGPESAFRGPKQPVVGVSWFDARDYCAFRGKRLPREAEWEKAARGTDGRKFPWGGAKPSAEHGVFGRAFGRDATEPVGQHPAGRGPYGHDDLAGNVWEWVDDIYDPYAYRRATAPEGKPGDCPAILRTQDELRRDGKQGFTGTNPIPSECERVLRGGAFNYWADGLRSANRVHHGASFRLVMSGFRCAKDAP